MVKAVDSNLLPIALATTLKEEVVAMHEDSAAETTDVGSDSESVSTSASSCAGDSAPVTSWRVVGANRGSPQVSAPFIAKKTNRRTRFSGTPLQPIPASPSGAESLSPKKRLGASFASPSPQKRSAVKQLLASPTRRTRLGRIADTKDPEAEERPAPEEEQSQPEPEEEQPPEQKGKKQSKATVASKPKARTKKEQKELQQKSSATRSNASAGKPDGSRRITPAPPSARPLPVGLVRPASPPRSLAPKPVARPPPGLPEPEQLIAPQPQQVGVPAVTPLAPPPFPWSSTMPMPMPPAMYPPMPAYHLGAGDMTKKLSVLSTDPLPASMQTPIVPPAAYHLPDPRTYSSTGMSGAHAQKMRYEILAQARRERVPLKVGLPENIPLVPLQKDLPAKKRIVYAELADKAAAPLDPALPLKVRLSQFLVEEAPLLFELPFVCAKQPPDELSKAVPDNGSGPVGAQGDRRGVCTPADVAAPLDPALPLKVRLSQFLVEEAPLLFELPFVCAKQPPDELSKAVPDNGSGPVGAQGDRRGVCTPADVAAPLDPAL
eukprot:CAMPEP_0178408808 /NCGR_PEP_ID=MMETSP0689_2-20121128/20133_1 /TAXON_ID=160604 /ORGANISM="Amphidinium massartii, Strain CS-259" /LENGTH=547 /DNA_ID=CAMNT_0020029921 /DNA_START=42 /DNA_END=1684 /DNA_ORIENTATION=-